MALLPLYHRDLSSNWGLPPWSDWNVQPWQDLTTVGFNDRFSNNVGHIFSGMDQSIQRMHENMWRTMQSMGVGRGGNLQRMLQELESSVEPMIIERNGTQMAQFSFDVKDFRPEDITIKTVDNTLEIEARRDENRDGAQMSHAYKRTITIPNGIDPEELQGKLIDGGVLRVEAPYRQPAAALSDAGRFVAITRD